VYPEADPVLGLEMRALTGEAMEMAYYKAKEATQQSNVDDGTVLNC
jgi:hypothetical protein